MVSNVDNSRSPEGLGPLRQVNFRIPEGVLLIAKVLAEEETRGSIPKLLVPIVTDHLFGRIDDAAAAAGRLAEQAQADVDNFDRVFAKVQSFHDEMKAKYGLG